MSAVDSALKTVETVQKVRRIIKLVSLCSSPYLLVGLFLAVLLALCVLLTLFPFLIFSDSEKLSASYASGTSSWYSTPTQLDADGSTYFWPVPTIANITSTFGYRDIGDGLEGHEGIDIANGADKTENQPIYAMAGGTVTVAGAVSGYGQAIYIDHGQGLVTIYGHLSTVMDVSVGEVVQKGQRIGFIGAGQVGRSTGPHLHFQVEVNGTAVDPLDYVAMPAATMTLELSYQALDIPAVKAYLKGKKSALADNDILQMIDDAGKSQNVDPHLLLAITGQEQSFVPVTNNHADQIIRNPWNVYGCWCSGKGATLTTEQAAVIAAKTIVKLSQNRPSGRDPIQWLVARDNPNGYYASDTGWWIGVSKFYQALLQTEGG